MAAPLEGGAFAAELQRVVAAYRGRIADASDDLALLTARMAAGDRLDDRRTFPGHLTTSAIVLDPPGRHVLLVLHKATGRWLQPGGHWEPAPGFAVSAQREAEEETGAAGLVLHPWHAAHDGLPVDIDTHAIPARPAKGEPDHWHFDMRFVFLAPAQAQLVAQVEEVSAAAWRPVSDLAAICPRVTRRLNLVG